MSQPNERSAADVHDQNRARIRLDALIVTLLDSGDITIVGARTLQRTLTAEGITT